MARRHRQGRVNPGGIPIDQRAEVASYARAHGLLDEHQQRAVDWWARGLGYKAISLVLQIPLDTARSRVCRGLAKVDRHHRELEQSAA